jgi:hypothetical protein
MKIKSVSELLTRLVTGTLRPGEKIEFCGCLVACIEPGIYRLVAGGKSYQILKKPLPAG